MARLLALMVLILGTVACVRTVDKRTQDDRPYFSNDLLNGLHWRRSAQPEKLMFVAGSADGFMAGLGYVGKPAIPSWFDNYGNCDAVIKEVDSFYQDEVNISLPHIYAFVYSEMKLAGATKQELDDYLNRSRQIMGLSWSSG